MDSKQLPSGAPRRARSRAWQFPLFLAISGSIVLGCKSGDTSNDPEPGIAAALDFLTPPPSSVAARAVMSPAPVIQVLDVNGDPVDTAGITVTATLSSGTGTLTGTLTALTNASGQASFGNLAIQGTVGTKALSFTASQVTGIQATGLTLTAGPAAVLTANSVTSQSSAKGQPVTAKPSVKVADLDGNGVAGTNVTFAITVGNGSLTGGLQASNASGIATVGSWTLDTAAGPNTMTATATGLGGSPQTFNATGTTVASQFSISLQYLLPVNPTYQAAFEAARTKWEQLITGDIADVTGLNIPADPSCGNVPISGTIDDVRILVLLDSIDGPSQILGAAGPCYIRNGLDAPLTLAGIMNFDTADVAGLSANGSLADVVFHEMGHVLGYGTLWTLKGMLLNSGSANPSLSGANTNAAYLTEGGSAAVTPTACETGAARSAVPVENSGGGGTANSHWEECIFRSEIMTGFISGTVRPVSKTSVQSMADLGYTVNAAAADLFNLATQPTLRATEDVGPVIDLRSDVLDIPLRLVDPSGQVVGTIRR